MTRAQTSDFLPPDVGASVLSGENDARKSMIGRAVSESEMETHLASFTLTLEWKHKTLAFPGGNHVPL